MRTKSIWMRLLEDGHRFIRREDLERLGTEVHMDYDGMVHKLQMSKMMVRVLKGIFYVRSADEVAMGYDGMPIYTMVGTALQMKGVDGWYLGLDTALRLNYMTHEFSRVNYMVTDSFRTTKVIQILGSDFLFLRWSRKRFETGILERNGIRWSDREKTVLDLVYRSCNRRKPASPTGPSRVRGILKEHGRDLDRDKIERYLVTYPVWMGELVWSNLRSRS